MSVKTYFKKFVFIAAIIAAAVVAALALISVDLLLIFFIAYLISFVFTSSNFFLMSKKDMQDNARFFAWFAGSFGLRFLGMIAAVFIGLKALNSHQIFFTVSFIFSYLCHSVIEIIFLNKILKTDT